MKRYFFLILLNLTIWIPSLRMLNAQPQPVTYTVEFVAAGAEQLPDPAQQAITAALDSWREAPPPDNTFYLIGLRQETDWAIATLVAADLSANPEPATPAMSLDELTDSIQDTAITPQNLVALLLVRTESGWEAALDSDPRVRDLLDRIPEAQLSPAVRDAIFPSNVNVLRRSVLEQPQQAYTNYKLPWPAGNPWVRTRSGLGWHGGTWNGRFPENNSLDFDIVNEANADILVSAPGVVTHICLVDGEQQSGVVIKTTGTDELLGYLHIDSRTLRDYIYIGAELNQGVVMGRMVEGTISETCGYSIGTHLHLFLPTRPFTMDGYTFSDTDTQGGVYLYSSQPGEVPFPTAPTNDDLMYNGDFEAGFTRWKTYLDSEATVLYEDDNAYVAWKGVSGAAGVIAQTLNYAVPDGSVLEMDMELGNATESIKHLRVHLHRYDNAAIWDDMLVCDFYVPPNTPLQTYVLRKQIATGWEDARVWIESWPADDQSWVLTDNVRVRRYESFDLPTTQCIGPVNQTDWQFTGQAGPQGWTVGAELGDPAVSSDGVRYTVLDASATLRSPSLVGIHADNYRYLHIDMASTADDCARVGFTVDGQREFNASQTVEFSIIPDEGLRTYTVDMAANPLWTGNLSRLQISPACGAGMGQHVTLARVRLGNTPPDFQLLSPVGMLTDTPGNPTYSWRHIPDVDYYTLYVAPETNLGNPVVYEAIPTYFCADDVCSVDATTINPAAWTANGDYVIYLSLTQDGQFSDWIGPYHFTVEVAPPAPPSLQPVTGTQTQASPTFNWTLNDESGRAAWFHLLAVPQSSPTTVAGQQWVSRRDACGTIDGIVCHVQADGTFINGEVYDLYMRSWGAGGLSSGGSLMGWDGPESFTPDVPPPGQLTGLSAADAITGSPTLSWSPADYGLWYQVWIGTLQPPATAYFEWQKAAAIGCNEGRCRLRLADPLPPGEYAWFVRPWGSGGFPTDALQGWQQGPSFIIPR